MIPPARRARMFDPFPHRRSLAELHQGGDGSGRLTLAGQFAVHTGWPAMNEYLARGMARVGAPPNLFAWSLNTAGLSAEFLDLYVDSTDAVEGPLLYSGAVDPLDAEHVRGFELFVRTMYEADEMPETWLPLLEQARCVIVPTPFNVDTFRRAGLRTPIEVLPDGVDPEVYPYRERPPRPGLTTLIVGVALRRKHHTEAIAAWQQAFEGDPDARLLVKTRVATGVDYFGDPRIEVIDRYEWSRGIGHWYERADVLLAMGNEGFGLPLIEAMATGLPVVALDSEGQHEICRSVPDLVLPVPPARWADISYRADGLPTARIAVPSVADIVARLRWVAEHRDEAREMGRAASAWIHRERDVWNYGPDMLAVIEQHSVQRAALMKAAT